jgi:hypothetical protein
MEIWTENLSLPAVLNDCMIQSYAAGQICELFG